VIAILVTAVGCPASLKAVRARLIRAAPARCHSRDELAVTNNCGMVGHLRKFFDAVAELSGAEHVHRLLFGHELVQNCTIARRSHTAACAVCPS